MYRKNTAGQFICVQLLLTATGAVATGLSPAARRCIDGTFAAGGGTFTEDGTTGSYKYALAQADTNGNDISIIVTATGAIPVCVNFVTTAADPTDATNFGLSKLTSLTFTGANKVDASVRDWIGGTIPAVNVTGVPLVDLKYTLGTISPATAGSVGIDWAQVANKGSTVSLTATTIATLTTYTGNTPQTGDGFARLGAPAGASIAADLAEIEGETDLLLGGVTVTTNNDKTGYALTAGERTSVADALLDRDMSAGADSGTSIIRTVRQALRFLRNKWSISGTTLTVCKEDDVSTTWTSTLATTAGANPVTTSDPAGP